MAELTRDQYIKEELVAKNLKDTAANRKKLGLAYDKLYLGGDRKDWRTYFKIQFPQLAGMLDGENGEAEARAVFGDLIDLFISVANDPESYDGSTDAGRIAWKNKVLATQYAIKTSNSQATWDATDKVEKEEKLKAKGQELRALYSGLGLTVTEIGNLAYLSLAKGMSDLELKYLSYGKLADRDMGGLMATKEATDLASSLRAYDYEFKDKDIKLALTGTEINGVPMTPELLLNKAKYEAGIKYAGFKDQFQQGFTVADVFGPYQKQAARTLDRSVADISLKNDLYRVALEQLNEDGTPMTMTQWNRMLKKDTKYGWQYTPEANSQITNIISTLEQGFGFRK